MTRLIGISEIAEIADLAPGTVHNISGNPDFPLSVKKRGKFNLYLECDVRLWLRDRVDGRKLRRKDRLNGSVRKR